MKVAYVGGRSSSMQSLLFLFLAPFERDPFIQKCVKRCQIWMDLNQDLSTKILDSPIKKLICPEWCSQNSDPFDFLNISNRCCFLFKQISGGTFVHSVHLDFP